MMTTAIRILRLGLAALLVCLTASETVAGPGDGTVLGATKIADNGPNSKRWNLVVIAEGFTSSQQELFNGYAQQVVDEIHGRPQLQPYIPAINVIRVNVASTQSGADDPLECGGTGVYVNTYFDASFCAGGIRRALVANDSLCIYVLNTWVPEWDAAVVLVNSTIYGGTGGQVAVFSVSSSWREALVHELGHSAFGLGDEYAYWAGCGVDTDANYHPQYEPAAPNATIQTDRSLIKWRDLILPTTPVPTTTNANCAECDPQGNPLPPATVGLYEGADYYHCRAYRPRFNCLMRALYNDFCPVCLGEVDRVLTPYMPNMSTVIVDDGFSSQVDVDVYNAANGTDYVFGYDAFATIQEGVNAVSGSTVLVLPGTYVEQIEINKPLALIGAGPGVTIIQSPVTLTKSFTNPAVNKPVIYVHDADSVTIWDLTVDGLGRGNTNNRFEGIAYFNAGGEIRHCEIKDVRETPINGNQHGVGIYAYVSAAPNRRLDVTNCHVHAFQKGGIIMNGTGLSAHADSCNVDGYGPADFIAMNGIQIGYGAAGTITNNQVSGCSYTGAQDASSAGLLLYSSTGPVTSSGNLVEECQIGINYLYVGGTISGNTVNATPAGTGLTNYWGIVADPGTGKARQPAPQPFDDPATAPSPKRAPGRQAASAELITTLVHQNVVDGGGGGTGIEADAYGTETLSLTVSENSATDCEAGLVLYRDATATLNATVSDNVLTSNLYGLYNWISQVNATGNTFTNATNAVDGRAGSFYDANCWSDYNGFPPYHVGGAGNNVDSHAKPECGVACYCPRQGDVYDDGVIDVSDVIRIIGIAFLNGLSPQDPRCPRQRADVDNSGIVDVNDVLYIIRTAFLNGPNPVNPCGP